MNPVLQEKLETNRLDIIHSIQSPEKIVQNLKLINEISPEEEADVLLETEIPIQNANLIDLILSRSDSAYFVLYQHLADEQQYTLAQIMWTRDCGPYPEPTKMMEECSSRTLHRQSENKENEIGSRVECNPVMNNPSWFEIHKRNGFMLKSNESIASWDFVNTSNRVFRLTLPSTSNPTETMSWETNWANLKVFRERMGRMELHQMMFVNMFELRRLIWLLPGIIDSVEDFFKKVEGTQLDIKEDSCNYPTPEQEHQCWDVWESQRRKLCASSLFYDTNSIHKCYIQLRLYVRQDVNEMFYRKVFISVRVGELMRMNTYAAEIAEKIQEVETHRRTNKI